MKRLVILAVALPFVSAWMALAAGVTTGWMTEEVRLVGLVTLPTIVMASLLVLYFDWRAHLMNRVPVEHDDAEDLREAA